MSKRYAYFANPAIVEFVNYIYVDRNIEIQDVTGITIKTKNGDVDVPVFVYDEVPETPND